MKRSAQEDRLYYKENVWSGLVKLDVRPDETRKKWHISHLCLTSLEFQEVSDL